MTQPIALVLDGTPGDEAIVINGTRLTPVEGCARCEETEHAMHLRIRAGYDKTIADSWRAKVAEVARERDEARAEIQRLKLRFDAQWQECHDGSEDACCKAHD